MLLQMCCLNFQQTCESNQCVFFMLLQKRKRKEKEDDTVSLSSFDLKVRLTLSSLLSARWVQI